MKLSVNAGHTISGAGYGASGLIKESTWTRIIAYKVMAEMTRRGHTVYNATVDTAKTTNQYLQMTVNLADANKCDYFVSIHLNASKDHKGQGCEVYTYQGVKYKKAVGICKELEKLGFKNRGVKNGSNLFVVKHTRDIAFLVEVFFCDNGNDVKNASSLDYEKIALAICDGLEKY